jgi:hypothetical protein
MAPTNRRPRTVDTSMHFCPHPDCDYRGWLGLNNLRANGHPGGGPWRQFHCTACDGFFPEHHGTMVVYRRRAVKKSELLRVGLQVLIDPVQPICNRIFAASLTRHGTFRRTVTADFDPSQPDEVLNPPGSAATGARGT